MPDGKFELNNHIIGHGFDPNVCNGEHPEVDSPCPKFKDGIVSRCGDCGCPMKTMDLFQAPPTEEDASGEGCPRVEAHGESDKKSL